MPVMSNTSWLMMVGLKPTRLPILGGDILGVFIATKLNVSERGLV